jgi:hypothetical protein
MTSFGDCRNCGCLFSPGKMSCDMCNTCETFNCNNLTFIGMSHCFDCEKCKKPKEIDETCRVYCIQSKCKNKHDKIIFSKCSRCEISMTEEEYKYYDIHSCSKFNIICIYCSTPLKN